MFRRIRIAAQITFAVIFTGLFVFANRRPAGYTWPAEWFLWLNPLSALLVSLASRKFVVTAFWGLGIALLTVVLGRFFCGFICPLGASVDAVDKLFAKSRSSRRRPPLFLQRAKYVVLLALAILAIFGALFPLFMDPISLSTRFLAFIFDPVAKIAASDLLHVSEPALRKFGLEQWTMTTLHIPLYYATAFTILLLVVVIGGTFWDRRFWCQYVCPSGALFGILSRFSLLRRLTVASHCNTCTVCTRVCPTHAIDEKHIERTNTSECIECGVCIGVKESCSTFAFSNPLRLRVTEPSLQRRHLLAGIAGGLLVVPVWRAAATSKRDEHGRLVRPPGAIPEPGFEARCIGCGECMRACPTNALQPCTFSDGFHRLYTPKLVPRVGGCEEKCAVCGHVCPTGALRKLPLEEKQFAKIGTAVIDRHRCLAWEQNKECVVCDEVCPYNAIEPRLVETTGGLFKVPVVDEDLCMGCGLCEQHCPIANTAAIVVYKFLENRRAAGPYMTDVQKEVMRKRRRKSDSGLYASPADSPEGAGRAAPVETINGTDPVELNDALPPGFE